MDYVPGVFQDNSFTIQYILDTSDKLSTELFQDKSEEASLDLVFELVNQLQYHTHQENGIEICMDFLQGTCIYGRDCLKHHTVLPYHWQIKRTTTQKWQSVSNDSQEHLERFYCNPENDRMRMKYGGQEFWADLNAMNVYETTEFDQLRRLSTPPSSNINSIYHTVWKFFCRDHFGWREYPESVIRLIEEANSRGLKEVRFMMWNNHYILHNSFFRREIKGDPSSAPVLYCFHIYRHLVVFPHRLLHHLKQHHHHKSSAQMGSPQQTFTQKLGFICIHLRTSSKCLSLQRTKVIESFIIFFIRLCLSLNIEFYRY